jgi:hypothetical protein
VRTDEVEHWYGVPMTHPLRTAVDLLMWGTDRDQDALDWLWRGGVDPAAAQTDLSARRSSVWTVRGLDVLELSTRGEPAPLAAVPLNDPATVWAQGRDALSPNASR